MYIHREVISQRFSVAACSYDVTILLTSFIFCKSHCSAIISFNIQTISNIYLTCLNILLKLRLFLPRGCNN